MKDINGKEIKTGDMVVVSGAYTKRHNGTFVVTHSPGDKTWTGEDYCLKKVKKDGTPVKSKYDIMFFPIISFTNNREYNKMANEHNAKYAKIEIISR